MFGGGRSSPPDSIRRRRSPSTPVYHHLQQQQQQLQQQQQQHHHKESPYNLYKEKSKTLNLKSNPLPNIRRTASLDTIYLTGQWPRDLLHTYCGRPMVDKFTQTPGEWEDVVMDKKLPPSKQVNTVANSDQLDKIRQRLQRSKESTRHTLAGGQHHSPVHGDHTAILSTANNNNNNGAVVPNSSSSPGVAVHQTSVSRAIAIPSNNSKSSGGSSSNNNIPKAIIPRMRNSVEGLNQEIEKLVLKGISGNDEDIERPIDEPTPDGHRAPIADLLRHTTRNVDTQTPSGASNFCPSEVSGGGGGGGGEDQKSNSNCNSSNNSSVVSSQSVSPASSLILEAFTLDTSRPNSSQNDADVHCQDSAPQFGKDDSSQSASPEPSDVQLGTSPAINKFLAREPPDGCERVKIVEESRKSQAVPFDQPAYCRPKPSNAVFKPSLSSAFYPPLKGFDDSMESIIVVHHVPPPPPPPLPPQVTVTTPKGQ